MAGQLNPSSPTCTPTRRYHSRMFVSSFVRHGGLQLVSPALYYLFNVPPDPRGPTAACSPHPLRRSSLLGHLIPSAFLCVIRHRGLQPELEPFPTREGSLCFPEGPFQTTLITESMAQPALQHLSDPAVSGFTMA